MPIIRTSQWGYEYAAPVSEMKLQMIPDRLHTDAPYHQVAYCTLTYEQMSQLERMEISYNLMATIATTPTMYSVCVNPCDDALAMRIKLIL